MCGIVGIAGPLKNEAIALAVKRMAAAIAHRGPDDEGTWVEGGFGFGVRRLSIIDLTGGHQPMFDERTGIGIVYNGELYNFRSLRDKMRKAGIPFRTTSDTEVILQSLALEGVKAVDDWNGMFAVASWDPNDRRLHLVRDRVGVKPLYYYWDGRILIFASEIKALLASGLFRPAVNRQAVRDYLSFQYVPGPETIWQRVWKLPPGHILAWSPETGPELQCYWQTDVLSVGESTPEQLTKEFEGLFLDSVQQQLLAADVPVGVLLSGGLDSSAIAAAAVELGHRDFHTFSIGFTEGGEFSELDYARLVAKHVGAQHHQVIVDESAFLDLLPEVVYATDEPLADPACMPVLVVSRLARERVKVVLSGEGSDELLAGYDLDAFVRAWETIKYLQVFPPFTLNMLATALGCVSGKYADIVRRVAHTPLAEWNITHKVHMTRDWQQEEKRSLWQGVSGLDSDRILESLYSTAASKEPLDQVLSVYQRSWLVDDLLMKADKMSMAASLELRVPYLDHRLVEWINRQPWRCKVWRKNSGSPGTKYILRRFAERRLPAEIIQRPKRGFPVPILAWLQRDTGSRWAKDCLLGGNSRLGAPFSQESVTRLLHEATTGNLLAARKVWLLIVLEHWLRQYDATLE